MMNVITDYSKPENWLYTSAPKHPVDVFYLYPSAWKRREGEHYICNADHDGMRKGAETVFVVQASAFFPVGNVYAPFYRQADGGFMLGKTADERREYLREAPVVDAVAACEYFLENFNEGRPFILAAHSQGSDVMKEILIDFMANHPDVYKNMIAAYIPGCAVTKSDLDTNPHLKFATCADDTGVIISYNTDAPDVSVPNTITQNGALVINPLSWVTDETPADASLNNGSLITGKGRLEVHRNFADATINCRNGTLICSTAPVTEFGVPSPLPTFHFCDYAFYYQNLRENAELRAQKFIKKNVAVTE